MPGVSSSTLCFEAYLARPLSRCRITPKIRRHSTGHSRPSRFLRHMGTGGASSLSGLEKGIQKRSWNLRTTRGHHHLLVVGLGHPRARARVRARAPPHHGLSRRRCLTAIRTSSNRLPLARRNVRCCSLHRQTSSTWKRLQGCGSTDGTRGCCRLGPSIVLKSWCGRR